MLVIRISINIFGDSFIPNELLKKVKIPVYSEESENCLTIQNPQRIGVEYNFDFYNAWYADFIENYHEISLSLGASETHVFFDVFYSEQCNFEIFDKEIMKRLSKYELSYPVSVYKTAEEELDEIIRQYGSNG